MKHIEVESIGYSWIITHSILQDWGEILSFEDWIFKLYDTSYLNGREPQRVTNIPKIDLRRYEGYKIELDVNCYEAIEYIYKLEWIKMSTWRVKYYILFWIWSLICVLFWIWYWVQLPEHKQAIVIKYVEEWVLKYITY